MEKRDDNFFEKFLLVGLKKLNLTLSSEILEKLSIYAALLAKWNKTYNLISSRSSLENIGQHILDSLTIIKYIRGPLVLDVGTGAGFPGLPLAFVLPQYQFLLLDSQGKKIRFLNQVLLTVHSQNVKVLEIRVEKFQPEQCFATIVSRATYSLSDMVTKIRHLICHNGQLLMMKGKYPKEELDELKTKLPNCVVMVQKLDALDENIERHLVCITVEKRD
jgi:16S rRNA (guanine527-N7)-methyltransferase